MEIDLMFSKSTINDGITKLKELTENLPPFPAQINFYGTDGRKGERGEKGVHGDQGEPGKNSTNLQMIDSGSNGYREYKMEEGECFAWFIHRSGNDVAVHRWYNSKGSKFPPHAHPEKEWIIIYKGVMEVTKSGKITVLNSGESMYNEPFELHSANFPEECRYITVTIPPAKEFPNGTR